MERKISCLRCQTPMRYISDEKIQLGQTGWLLGDLPNLLSGALEVAIYTCPSCRKIELFQTMQEACDNAIAQQTCPNCGKMHDMDYPKCPFCKYSYT